MFLGLFNRTLFVELVRVFLLSLAGMTGIFVFFGVVQTASQNGLSFSQIVNILPLVVPMSWPYTIPATTLFASCVVYGRLSNDNEAVALKAAGVDLYTALRPALLLGAIATAATAGLLHTVVPRSLQRQEAEFLKDPEETMYNLLKRDRALRGSPDPEFKSPSYSLYVRDVQNRQLKDVVVKRRPAGVKVDPDTGVPRIEYDFVARTPTATLKVNLDSGKVEVDSPLWTVWGATTNLNSRDSPPVEIDLPDSLTGKGVRNRPQAVTWDQLPVRLAELAAEQAGVRALRDEQRRLAADPTASPAVVAGATFQEPLFAAKLKELDRQMRSLDYEYQSRPALAVGCLIFAAIGCPVGLWFSRSDYLSAFMVCFLPSMILYYSATFAGGGLARDGKVPMAVGVWAADGLLGLAAVVLAWRLIKR